MKKIRMLLGLRCVAAFLVGCGDGLALTGPERSRQRSLINDLHYRMMVDDLDYIMFYDTNSKLSEYHPYAGR